MVGRPKDNRKTPKKEPTRKNKVRPLETRGITYKEPAMIGSFWRDYTMDQVQAMSDEELMQNIDTFLDGMIKRAIAYNKNWDYPILSGYLRIASLPKK